MRPSWNSHSIVSLETRSLIDCRPLEWQPGVGVRRRRLAGRFVETGWGRVLVERLGRGLCRTLWLLPVDSWRSQSSASAAQLRYFLSQPLEFLHDHAKLLLQFLGSLCQVSIHAGRRTAEIALVTLARTHRSQGSRKLLFPAIAPDSQVRHVPGRNRADDADYLLRLIDCLTIDYHQNVAGFQTGFVRRTAGSNSVDPHARTSTLDNEHTQFTPLRFRARLAGLSGL